MTDEDSEQFSEFANQVRSLAEKAFNATMTQDETFDARMTLTALIYAVGCAARVAGLSLDVAKDGIEIAWDVIDSDIAAGLLNLPKKVGE